MSSRRPSMLLKSNLSVAALALLTPAAAWSQSATPPASEQEEAAGGLLEVTITAQFRSENVQDAPLAVTAVSAEMLEARSQSNVTEVATRAPNVTLTPAGQGFGNTATAHIRGVGQNDFNFALEPGVGMYVDDVYYGVTFGSVFELIDLERVEILRGPQGTLAGKNSLGGAIKLFSKLPDGKPDGSIEATVGNFDRIDVRASGDLTLKPDKLFLRVSALARQRDGFLRRLDYSCVTGSAAPSPDRLRTGCEIGREGGQSLWALRGALRWLASDAVQNNLILDITEDDSEPPATKLLGQGPWAGTNNYITGPESYTNYETYIAHPGTSQAYPVPPVNSLNGWGASNTLDVQLGENLSLKSITAYRRSSGEFVQAADASPAAQFTHFWEVDHEQRSQELRLSGAAFGARLNWTLGGFYYDADSRMGGRINVSGGLVPGGGLATLPNGNRVVISEFLFDDPVESESKSGFAHVAFAVTDALNITGGIRYTEESKDYTFVRLAPNGAPHPMLGPLNGFTGSYSGSRWDYRLAADYRWTDTFMTYAQWSTGFKGGGVNPRPFFPDQVRPFDPETLRAYEAGFKSDLFSQRMRLNGAIFYNLYDDVQLGLLTCPPPSTPTPCNMPANVGNSKLQGAELELEVHPVDGLIIDASASYIDFEYRAVAPTTGVTRAMTTPFTPEWKASAGLQYEFPVGGLGSLTPRLDYTYQSEMFVQAVNSAANRVESRGLLNARVTYRTAEDDWEVALAVTNATDKFYYVNKYERAAAPYFLVNGQPGRPMEWFVTVKRRFGT